jgi:hypothetical protein
MVDHSDGLFLSEAQTKGVVGYPAGCRESFSLRDKAGRQGQSLPRRRCSSLGGETPAELFAVSAACRLTAAGQGRGGDEASFSARASDITRRVD